MSPFLPDELILVKEIVAGILEWEGEERAGKTLLKINTVFFVKIATDFFEFNLIVCGAEI